MRIALEWTNPNDLVELEGRHNVGFGMHSRWNTMPLNSESCSSLYKEMVSGSQDKALELFATKKVDSRVHTDLNRCASHEVHDTASSPPRMTQNEMSQPTLTQL